MPVTRGTTENWELDGHSIHVTHRDKLYWPATEREAGFTKGDVLRYYAQVAPTLLPYVHARPVTLRVYPDGVQGTSYYQRDRPARAPGWLRSTHYLPKTSHEPAQLILVDDSASLIWLANAGSIEFHVWSSGLADLNLPNWAIFDLDPGEEATFADVLQTALWLRDLLDHHHVNSAAKTSGGRGLHVYVPLDPGQGFDAVRAWVKQMAEELAMAHPELVAVASGSTPTHQGARVTIDYAQNSLGRNTAAPYTLRAHPTAPTVSTPLTWEEVAAGGFHPTDFTPPVALERIGRLGDLFTPVLAGGQRLDQ